MSSEIHFVIVPINTVVISADKNDLVKSYFNAVKNSKEESIQYPTINGIEYTKKSTKIRII